MQLSRGKDLILVVQHPVANAQLIDDVLTFPGAATQFFADVGHVDLELFDAAVIHIAPDGTNDGGIGQHLAGALASSSAVPKGLVI